MSWYYALHWDKPSRMAIVKNALGNSVTIRSPLPPTATSPGNVGYLPPDDDNDGTYGEQTDWPSPTAGGALNQANWAGGTITYLNPDNAGDRAAAAAAIGLSMQDPNGDSDTWVFQITGASPIAAPGLPFEAYDHPNLNTAGSSAGTMADVATKNTVAGTDWGRPTLGSMTNIQAPRDVIGQTSAQVNWGLVVYSGDMMINYPNATFPTCLDGPYGCDKACTLVDVDITDSGDVSVIEAYMQENRITTTVGAGTYKGLNGRGNTSTSAGLKTAKGKLLGAFQTDPKYLCKRPYGVILVTDGLSGACNPANPTNQPPGLAASDPYQTPVGTFNYGNWASPCGTCPGTNCCDTNSSGWDCTTAHEQSYNQVVGTTPTYEFAAGVSEQIYNLNLIDPDAGGPKPSRSSPIKPRTYVIGIAPEVGRCELNYTAFRGRGDAYALSNGSIGDTRLPLDDNSNTPDNYELNKAIDYAFFATSSDTIANAIISIVLNTAQGDYSTSAPTSASAANGFANFVFLASTQFPSWEGHFYKFDITKYCPSGEAPGYRTDFADVLNARDPDTRKIYTWDPAPPHNLLELMADGSNLGTINTYGGTTGIDQAVLDFIRGKRTPPATVAGEAPWLLGPSINSTTAVVGAPLTYTQNLPDHGPFQYIYQGRAPTVWLGANDGMLHAFAVGNGDEVLALVPPNLLARQIELYNNYSNPDVISRTRTGQPKNPASHVYGIGSSFRFGDVYFPSVSTYKTVGIITQGGGGSMIAAIDATHPSPTDPNYGFGAGASGDPVKILWSKVGEPFPNATPTPDIPNLFNTWSVPALAAVRSGATTSEWAVLMGAGFNPCSSSANPPATPCPIETPPGPYQKDPRIFTLDPRDGTVLNTLTVTSTANPTPGPWVGNQTFADGVLYKKDAFGFKPDNVADLGVSADLNGRIWFTYPNSGSSAFTNISIGIDATAADAGLATSGFRKGGAGQQQPIYYSPGVSGIKEGTAPNGCDIYTFGSGTPYEKSNLVSGPNIGLSGSFVPHLYVAINDKATSQVPNDRVLRIPIQSILVPTPTPTPTGTPVVVPTSVACGSITPVPTPTGTPAPTTTPIPPNTYMGPRTQVVASPLLLVSQSRSNTDKAIFLVYDPDRGCVGNSYVVVLEFTPATTCDDITVNAIQVFDSGAGAASGVTLAQGEPVSAQSGPGEGGKAGLFKPDLPVGSLSLNQRYPPIWWRELK